MFTGADEYGVDPTIDDADMERLLAVTPDDADAPASLSFSWNVFVSLTTACRYTCTYCTCYDAPGEATLMSLDEVYEMVRTGADAGCTETPLTFGDAPDERYTEVHRQLDEWDYDDILDYLAAACEVAPDEGLLPHLNSGDLTHKAFADLAPLNASMGVMLETTADMAIHSGSRRKTPGQRLNTIRAAGEADVPFTTGILVGIGETWRDRAEGLLTIRALHERYGHIQEVIVQNVIPNERPNYERPSLDTMRRVVAMARVAFPEEVSVQVSPDLSAAAGLVAYGVDDLGSVSPVVDDYVNPDYEWLAFRELADIADEAGVPFCERLPVYERLLPNGVLGPAGDPGESGGVSAVVPDREWLRGPITDRLTADDVHERRFRNVVRGDGLLSIPRWDRHRVGRPCGRLLPTTTEN